MKSMGEHGIGEVKQEGKWEALGRREKERRGKKRGVAWESVGRRVGEIN